MAQPGPERRLGALDDRATSDLPSRPIGKGLHELRHAIVVGLFDERLVDGHRIVAGGRAERPRDAGDDDLAEDLIGRRAARALTAAARPEDHGVDPHRDRSAGAPDARQGLCERARKFLSDPPRGRITHLRPQRSEATSTRTPPKAARGCAGAPLRTIVEVRTKAPSAARRVIFLDIDSASDFHARGTRAMSAPAPYLWSDHASANCTAIPVAAIRRKGAPSKSGRLIASTSKLRSITASA
jgi:hypothetical protein